MEIRDGGCNEMTWYGEQFETRPFCWRKQVELKRKQVELKKKTSWTRKKTSWTEKKQVELKRKQVELKRKQVELKRKQVELKRKQVELKRKQVEQYSYIKCTNGHSCILHLSPILLRNGNVWSKYYVFKDEMCWNEHKSMKLMNVHSYNYVWIMIIYKMYEIASFESAALELNQNKKVKLIYKCWYISHNNYVWINKDT